MNRHLVKTVGSAVLAMAGSLAAGMTAIAQDNAAPAPPQSGAQSTTIPGLGKPISVIRFAPSGMKQRIGNFTALFTDCSPMGSPIVRFTKPPEHGTLTTEDSKFVANFGVNNVREKCNDKPYPSTLLYYTSEDKYLGKDSANVFVIWPDGTATEWDFLIDIR